MWSIFSETQCTSKDHRESRPNAEQSPTNSPVEQKLKVLPACSSSRS